MEACNDKISNWNYDFLCIQHSSQVDLSVKTSIPKQHLAYLCHHYCFPLPRWEHQQARAHKFVCMHRRCSYSSTTLWWECLRTNRKHPWFYSSAHECLSQCNKLLPVENDEEHTLCDQSFLLWNTGFFRQSYFYTALWSLEFRRTHASRVGWSYVLLSYWWN